MKSYNKIYTGLPKLVLTDIDGVWTDGSMYYDDSIRELKRFNTYDSAGVLFLKLLDIPVIIITGESTEIVSRRAKKLNIENVYLGVKDKLSLTRSLCTDIWGYDLNDVAFIGDDINDIPLLKAVGISCCPSNAPEYVKKLCTYTTKKKGGDGAFREFVEILLQKENMLDFVVNKYLEEHINKFSQ